MLVSLRVFRAKCQYFSYAAKVLVRVPQRNTELRGAGYFFDDYVFISLNSMHVIFFCVFKRSLLLGVKICLSHAQIDLL